MTPTRSTALALGMLGLLVGCGEDAGGDTSERIRAIKPYYVSEPAGGDVRRYSGTIAPSDTSALSFAVSGTVATVAVNHGDRVVAGQVLATLDPKPLELDVQALPLRPEISPYAAFQGLMPAPLFRAKSLQEMDAVRP